MWGAWQREAVRGKSPSGSRAPLNPGKTPYVVFFLSFIFCVPVRRASKPREEEQPPFLSLASANGLQGLVVRSGQVADRRNGLLVGGPGHVATVPHMVPYP